VPKIWEQVSSDNGTINSNYGWCIWSKENHEQYNNVLTELVSNKFTRRAQMIYTRPTMHRDYNIDGMSDFICTTAVQYFIRDDKLISYVTMRSNDAIFGYKGDYHWQKYVLDKLSSDLGICSGDIIWNVGSFHVYERHFNLIT
jgi:thymidylate synthase